MGEPWSGGKKARTRVDRPRAPLAEDFGIASDASGIWGRRRNVVVRIMNSCSTARGRSFEHTTRAAVFEGAGQ